MRKWSSPLLAVLLLALCASCMRPEDFNRDMFADSGIDYDVALPLTDTRLTMANLIDLRGGVFVPDDTSLLHIIYSMEPIKQKLIDDVTMKQESPFVFSTPEVTYARLKDTLITVSFLDTIHLNMHGLDAKVEDLYFSTSRLAIKAQNSFLAPMDLEMRFENIRDKNGEKIILLTQSPARTNRDTVLELQDIRLQMDDTDNPYIVMSSTAKVRIEREEGDSNVYKGSLYVSSNFQQMDFWRADGYFDRKDYQLTGTMSIEGLGLERMQNISFSEARILANLRVNGVSAPLRFTKTEVLVHNKESESTRIALFPENYDVAVPAITDDPLEKESQESREIVDMLIDRPYNVTYTVDGLLNPDNDETKLQAIQTGGYLSLGLGCDIPLHFSADRYSLCDTLEVSLDDLGSDTELRYFDVKSIVRNAFPLDVAFSLHFLDEDYNRLFSLFHDDLVAGGKIGPAPGLHVVEPTIVRFEDVLDGSEMKFARRMHYVAVDAKISTTDQQMVKVYVDGEKEGFVDVKVGIRIKVRQKGLLDF